ncbi:MAG: histidine--tRNA ligase [Lactobacillus sp.]|jgi:histidyl-tRNA synthetase|uniref:Histidine--tRNA ligase n=1 Tax=Lacticaseibacillus suilingensis TaxID=2799577 RepID=A0ABW4BJN9_9LACO|nr:histidine--tRNA ligase [Lacticaseibacillus suilingensis]MCI1895231.1 histidine--tRNA ligase [Lactobacillus sp.]MCI1917598.1 histidine--tRNA ligase [Lactobacillus sp.]MCI1942445.1 histidine--tRNA ligase [Lactobacillus sp.]MCI1973024.1 histidine--tRNA ligase [Lactobacillus sp.]MCI2017726.1 histidine--tRNA ligase [Lactobacillus sp.]
MSYQRPKGTADILPGQSELWQKVEQTARDILTRYRYQEIRTPLFENYDVFARSSGETSDVVSKEMYTFEDKGGRQMALRPEGTAGVVRAYVENKLYGPEYTKPYKVYYMGPMYRYERPQSGRQREFHQIGVEAFGGDSPALDAEVIALAKDLLEALGAKHLKFAINTLGDPESRQAYHAALIAYLTPFKDQLSEDSKVRLEKNPLRILDSKDRGDQAIVADAPKLIDYLTPAAAERFAAVQADLTALGISFEIDPDMVRGLDYYNHTIFEVMSDDAVFGGGYTTILGGGRYNGLVEELGGPETPGIGFGMGVERAMLLMQGQTATTSLPAYIVTIDEAGKGAALHLAHALRQQGLAVDMDFLERKAKAQFKSANKANAQYVLTIGESELANGTVQVKNMQSGNQEALAQAALEADFLNQVAKLEEAHD